jgi:hypothetical protein
LWESHTTFFLRRQDVAASTKAVEEKMPQCRESSAEEIKFMFCQQAKVSAH